MLGQTPRIFQGRQTDPNTLERLKRCLIGGVHFVGSTYNYRKDGGEFLLEWSISPVFDNDGEPCAYIAIQRQLNAALSPEDSIVPAGKMAGELLSERQGAHGVALPPRFRALVFDEVARAGLTGREAEVLTMALAGTDTQDMVARLDVSPRTLKFHLHNMYEKFGVADRRRLYERFIGLLANG
jgi:DNA-binding CsgD family transcriptional regulator